MWQSHADPDADCNTDATPRDYTDAQATSDSTAAPIVRTLFGLKAGTRERKTREFPA